MKFTSSRRAARLAEISVCLGEAHRRVLRLKRDLSYAVNSAPSSDWPEHFASVFTQAAELHTHLGHAFGRAMRFDDALHDALSRSFDHAWNVFHGLIGSDDGDTPMDLYFEARHHLGLLDEELARASQCVATSRAANLGVASASSSQYWASVPVSGTASRVAAWSTRILPCVDRARYREEFQGELYELAETGAARRAQLWYTLRLLTRAWQLRVEVKKAARSRRAVS